MKIITRSIFYCGGVCESCESPDDKHSCVYTCIVEGEDNQYVILCGECISQHDISSMKLTWDNQMFEPIQITEKDITKMKEIDTWDKVVRLKIAVNIMGKWLWISGTDPNYWLYEQ